jgi:ParB-like chromosome segregation protein Spo0J
MAEFGWTVPCLVAEDGELIADHGRVLAATQLGLTEAPVIVLGHLTEAQRRAYRLADNKRNSEPGTRNCCQQSCRNCWQRITTCR